MTRANLDPIVVKKPLHNLDNMNAGIRMLHNKLIIIIFDKSDRLMF